MWKSVEEGPQAHSLTIMTTPIKIRLLINLIKNDVFENFHPTQN